MDPSMGELHAIVAASDSTWIVGGATALAFLLALVVGRRGRLVASSTASRQRRLIASTESEPGEEPPIVSWFEASLLLLLLGHALFDRGFAWFHIPGTPLFVSELVLGLGVAFLLTTRNVVAPMVRRSYALKSLRLFMAWGALLLALGVTTWGFDAIRDSALWYYGLFAFMVAALIGWDPTRLDKWSRLFGRALPAILIWYPFAVLAKNTPLFSINVPDSNVPMLSHRAGNMAVIAAIGIAYLWLVDSDHRVHSQQRNILTTLATVVILFTGLQNRGGLVATTVAVIVLLFMLSRRRGDLAFVMFGVGIVLASLALAFDIRLELFDQRDVSVDQFVENVTSIFDREAGSARERDTTEWRLRIWQEVLTDVTNDMPVAGFGPGPDLGEVYEISTNPDAPLRNPHNSHVGILARLGWVGVVLWSLVWISWFAALQTTRRRLRARQHLREAGLAGWIMISPIPILVNAVFDPTLEGPQVSVWLWAFFGAGAALAVLSRWGNLGIDQPASLADTKSPSRQ